MNPVGNIMLRSLARLQSGAWCVFVVALLAGCNAKSPGTGSVASSNGETAKPQAAVEADAKPPLGRVFDPEAQTRRELGAERQAVEGRPQLERPSHDAPETPVGTDGEAPQKHTSFYRSDTAPAKIPSVALTKREEALCKVKVGDAMPAIALPKIGGGAAKLAGMFGKKATVVVFWKGDRRMALEELADIGPDVIDPFGKDGVTVVGIAVKESAASAPEALTNAGAKFTNLLDADGKVFAQVGSERLPRTYVLDPKGKIVWFDIEYSHATRRELHDALRAVTGDAGAKPE